MTITIDPTLYAMFERIVREAPDATVYRVTITDTRLDGSDYKYDRHLKADEKNQIPWDTLDAIADVTWAGFDRFGVPHCESVRISLDTANGGINVFSALEQHWHHSVVVKPETPPRSYEYLGTMLHKVQSEDDAVAKVLEFIQSVVDDNADQESNHDPWEDYDDRSRFDPLDERNYPLHKR